MLKDFVCFWNIWSILSILLTVGFALFGALLFRRTDNAKRPKWLTPYVAWIAGIVLTASFMMAPIYFKSGDGLLSSSLQHAIRMFAMDGNVSDVLVALREHTPPAFTLHVYRIIVAMLYVFAAACTFGFILTFFKNLMAQMRYSLSRGKHIHLFSELNDRSLALAKSIAAAGGRKGSENGKLPFIIFADIIDKSEEKHMDLVEEAAKLGAAFYRRDLSAITLRRGKREHSIYLISADETEKLRHAEQIMNTYRDREDISLYIFSDSQETECFLNALSDSKKSAFKMKIERVNDIRFLIYHYLDEHNIDIFRHAKPRDGIRELSFAVLGLGRYGIELVKALLWYCQLPGFRVRITVFDKDEAAESRMRAMLPALSFNTEVNGEEDMRYYLRVLSGSNVETAGFREEFAKLLPRLGHAFVMLGDDAENLSTSLALRRLLAQHGCPETEVSTIIYNPVLCKRLNERHTGDDPASKLETMRIHAFGDIDSFYSSGTVIKSDLVAEGLAVHTMWSPEYTYYSDDYNFYSSLAKALHYRLRARIIRQEREDFPYREIFGDLYENTEGFIIENTVSPEIANNLQQEYKKALKLLPDIDGSRKINELLSAREAKETPFAYSFRGMTTETVYDLLHIAEAAAKIDHVRWNAYMRAEGFVLGAKSTELRTHHNLVPVGMLTLDECLKDI